ncbi:hypothetical protein LXL04_024207 [Taraxacum kok-saghyz]
MASDYILKERQMVVKAGLKHGRDAGSKSHRGIRFHRYIRGNKSTPEKSKSRPKSQSKIQDQKSKAQPETEPESSSVTELMSTCRLYLPMSINTTPRVTVEGEENTDAAKHILMRFRGLSQNSYIDNILK